MKKPSRQSVQGKGHTTAEESSLKGTFVSVLILAAIMVASWAAIMLLFLERF
ncbi:cytochrome c oxidase subunit 2A [Indiicoccus explosivorum]|uniref:cytochrome c oxidase subunit 2A n=1 Tax=Indiicoccus explosivorum TaxID=1917864 RepID=UPI000B44C210|nr:cytochrome c oxidase subunit 2A [Indiicoccus explosivorum]